MIAVITVCIAVILLITVAIAFVFTTQVHVNLMIFWKAKDYETVFGIRSLFPLVHLLHSGGCATRFIWT